MRVVRKWIEDLKWELPFWEFIYLVCGPMKQKFIETYEWAYSCDHCDPLGSLLDAMTVFIEDRTGKRRYWSGLNGRIITKFSIFYIKHLKKTKELEYDNNSK